MNPRDAKFLRSCLSYEPSTGVLTWKERPASHFNDGSKTAEHLAAIWNAQYSGKQAFLGLNNHGYHSSTLSGKRMTAHRVAWAIHFGEWPVGEIDHINGIRTDNRIENLREVDRKENAKNLSVKSGALRGIYWYAATKRWVAKINSEGRMLHLGYHRCLGKAMAARREAEMSFGYHQNHGRTH